MLKIDLGDITAEIERKNIRNIHLRVYPPNGQVRITAPKRASLNVIRMFAVSRLNWIKKHQARFCEQAREIPEEYKTGENHYFFGKPYLLQVLERNSKPNVIIKHDALILQVRPDSGIAQRKAVLTEWYRKQLKAVIPAYIEKWESEMRVHVKEFGVKRMKTRWGTCNRKAGRIWINLVLAKKSPECLEYIIVHEMVHLLEAGHGKRFYAYMDRFMPQWRHIKEKLNKSPLNYSERQC